MNTDKTDQNGEKKFTADQRGGARIGNYDLPWQIGRGMTENQISVVFAQRRNNGVAFTGR